MSYYQKWMIQYSSMKYEFVPFKVVDFGPPPCLSPQGMCVFNVCVSANYTTLVLYNCSLELQRVLAQSNKQFYISDHSQVM